MAAHAPWSCEEVSLLLCACADAVESRPPREVGHTAFLRCEALYCASACGGHSSVLSRAEASVFNKHKSLENMHTVISLFLASISVTSGQNKEEECSYLRSSDKLRMWCGMPETKRRRWFTTHNKKSYLYTEMTEEQFVMITEILVKSNGSILSPLSVYVRPKAKVTKSESEPESIAAAAQVVEEELAVVPPPPPPQRSDSVVGGDGSATESEDDWEEIIPPSPVRGVVQGSGAIAVSVTKQVSTDSLSIDTFNSRSEIESPKHKFTSTSDASLAESAAHPDKRSKLVEPEIFTLLSVLEEQSRTLKEAYRSTKLARRRDQAERQEILRSLRQEQNERQQILERLRRQEEEVRQQRAAWRCEQEEIRREYAELLDDN